MASELIEQRRHVVADVRDATVESFRRIVDVRARQGLETTFRRVVPLKFGPGTARKLFNHGIAAEVFDRKTWTTKLTSIRYRDIAVDDLLRIAKAIEDRPDPWRPA